MKFNCTFCKQELNTKNIVAVRFTSWLTCEDCNVAYEINFDKIVSTRFYASLRGVLYCLDLQHVKPKTQILLLPPDVEDTVIIVLTLPYIIDGITPDNCQEKIKTYITFS